MGIVQQVKRGYRQITGAGSGPVRADAPRQTAVELSVPNPFGGEALCRARVALSATAHADGESLRLQAHMQSCLRLPEPAPRHRALPGPAARASLVARGRRAAGGVLRFGLSRLPARTIAPLQRQRVQTWLDIQASSQPLAAGAQALVPDRLRQMCRDLPARRPGEPLLATWFGQSGGATPAVAQLTTLQVNQDDLQPGSTGRPFSLSASLATLIEDERAGRSEPP